MDSDRSGVAGLAELRRRLGRSQAEIAGALGTTQSGISRIERQADVRVSTLSDYVDALGARLTLLVEFDGLVVRLDVPALASRRFGDGRSFRVIWQDPSSRSLVSVGRLQFDGREFVFSYTSEASSSLSFRPFAPFPNLAETYRSPQLVPFFAVRLLSSADPEFDAAIAALGLNRTDATPVELLTRAPSDSPHDTIQVVPDPITLEDGSTVTTFLASGSRHVNENEPNLVGDAIERLSSGAELQLVDEPTNSFNPRAIQLARDGQILGWVPDYLLEQVHGDRGAGRRVEVRVDRANGRDAPWHLRLVCKMSVAQATAETT